MYCGVMLSFVVFFYVKLGFAIFFYEIGNRHDEYSINFRVIIQTYVCFGFELPNCKEV